MDGPKDKGSYAESREKQAEFEEHLREEGDWQEAVDEVIEGNPPDEEDRVARGVSVSTPAVNSPRRVLHARGDREGRPR